MAEIRATITSDEDNDVEYWRKKTDKTRRAFVREALTEYITKLKNAERGLEPVFVRSKHQKQTKLDLD